MIVNKKLKEVLHYFNYTGTVTFITKDKTTILHTDTLDSEKLNKRVGSCQLNCGQLVVWLEE